MNLTSVLSGNIAFLCFHWVCCYVYRFFVSPTKSEPLRPSSFIERVTFFSFKHINTYLFYSVVVIITFFMTILLSTGTDCGHMMAKSQMSLRPKIQIPIPNKYLEFGYKGLVFWRNNGWLMEKMGKDSLKYLIIHLPKLSAQIVFPSPHVSMRTCFIGRP